MMTVTMLACLLAYTLLIVTGTDAALEVQVKEATMEAARMLALNTALEAALAEAVKAVQSQNRIIERLKNDRVADLTRAFVARNRSAREIEQTLRQIEDGVK